MDLQVAAVNKLVDDMCKKAGKALTTLGQYDAGVALKRMSNATKQANNVLAQSQKQITDEIVKSTKVVENYNAKLKTTQTIIQGYDTNGQKVTAR